MQRPPTPPLYRPVSNIPFHIHLATWTNTEIGSFLSLQRCAHHARKFEENDITGSVILELGAEELKELGVTKVGERVRLLGAIRELKRRNSTSLAAVNGGGGRDSSNGGSTPASASSFASVQAQQQGGHLRTASSARRVQSNGMGSGTANQDQYSVMSENQGLRPASRSDHLDRETPELARTLSEHHNQTGSATLSRSRSGTGGSLKRLHATRPPPLHLHSSSHGQVGSMQGQAETLGNGGGDQRVLADSTSTATTPRGLPISALSDMNGPGSNGSLGPSGTVSISRLQPGSGSSLESLNPAMAVPLGRSSSMRAREQAYPAGINGGGSNVPGPQGGNGKLRAPGQGSGSYGLSPPGSSSYLKRSPSPVPPSSTTNPVPIGRRGSNEYMARPLPGLPPEGSNSRRPSEGDDTEDVARKSSGSSLHPRTTGGSLGSSRAGGSDSRPAISTGVAGLSSGSTHRRGASAAVAVQPLSQRNLGAQSGVDARRAGSKRPSTDSGSNIHPYAASAPRPIRGQSPTKNSSSPTKARFDSNRATASDGRGDITPTYPTSSENRRRYDSPARSPNDEMVHIKGQRSWSDRWASEKSSTPTLSLEDVKRKLVKFILSEDETSRTIDVEACQNGFEVLEKALRKFGKWRGIARGGPAGLSKSESDTDERSCLDVDGWGVYLHKGEDAQPLTEAELLAVCYAPPTDPARENGLYLRQMRILPNRKDIGAIFGDTPPAVSLSPTSPIHSMVNSRERDSPRTANSLRNMHQTHRASMVSVMSALGVLSNDNAPKPAPAQAPLPKSPSSGSFLANRGRKIHNFFGHRPPSEIISNHLYDYFPAAKRKDLEKTARNSMLRLSMKGDMDLARTSIDSSRLSMDNNRLPSRFSIASSNSSHRMSRASSHKNISTPPSAAIPEEGQTESKSVPRVSISGDDGREVRPAFEEDESTSARSGEAPLIPPFEHSEESLSDSMPSFASDPRPQSLRQDRRNSVRSSKSRRLSTISSRRKSRRISDAASLLTVDEITAEVENRRASVITFAESEEDAEDATDHFLAPGAIRLSRAYSPGLVPQEEGEVSDLEDSFEEEDEEEETDSEEEESEEEEDEDEQEENDNHGKAVTSTGANRSIKWIKGALIGQGAFGKVYLGMDSQNGLLMAVKQVDLEMSATGSEEKKQSMVSAMQQEIALLKNLQHENIVQYLDSSTDEHHLNIFLEYVPGGSVTALLNNYGAFEEALVKNFVRQILIGLEYLHERNIIHRDIKGANILVDNKGGVKISDFGISKKVGNNSFSHMRLNRASLQGSVFWMAPEVVKQTAYTKKADIWSVGCLVVEMLTGEHPWPDLTQMQAIFRIGSSARPSNPTDISTDAAIFLDRTFLIDHIQRPTASELLSQPFLRAG